MNIQSPNQALRISPSLLLLTVFYGGMVTIAGVLGAKQVALGPLAVEAGIFPFLLLISISSSVAELHGKPTADRLAQFGFVPLVGAILLSFFVLQLPTDPGMYEPAKAA
ncbi:MAG: VUT family protein, partial [Novosphingobium sp.]